jgi:hypothetical protein
MVFFGMKKLSIAVLEIAGLGELDAYGLDIPDLVRVVLDGPVAGEHAHVGDVAEGAPVPVLLVLEGRGDGLLGVVVGLEVCGGHVGVVVEGVDDGLEDVWFARGEEVGGDQVQGPSEKRLASMKARGL